MQLSQLHTLVALPAASNQQMVNDIDFPCPGPTCSTWGRCGSGEGRRWAEQGRSAGRTSPDDYSSALKTRDWGWGKVSGSAPGKSMDLDPLPRGRACGPRMA